MVHAADRIRAAHARPPPAAAGRPPAAHRRGPAEGPESPAGQGSPSGSHESNGTALRHRRHRRRPRRRPRRLVGALACRPPRSSQTKPVPVRRGGPAQPVSGAGPRPGLRLPTPPGGRLLASESVQCQHGRSAQTGPGTGCPRGPGQCRDRRRRPSHRAPGRRREHGSQWRRLRGLPPSPARANRPPARPAAPRRDSRVAVTDHAAGAGWGNRRAAGLGAGERRVTA